MKTRFVSYSVDRNAFRIGSRKAEWYWSLVGDVSGNRDTAIQMFLVVLILAESFQSSS